MSTSTVRLKSNIKVKQRLRLSLILMTSRKVYLLLALYWFGSSACVDDETFVGSTRGLVRMEERNEFNKRLKSAYFYDTSCAVGQQPPSLVCWSGPTVGIGPYGSRTGHMYRIEGSRHGSAYEIDEKGRLESREYWRVEDVGSTLTTSESFEYNENGTIKKIVVDDWDAAYTQRIIEFDSSGFWLRTVVFFDELKLDSLELERN